MNNRSFGILDPISYLRKIEREHERLSNVTHKSIDDEIDHALNFSFTAWHLVDWLWKSERTKDKLSELGYKKFEDFHSFVRASCPELQICYEIALGLKHFSIHESQAKAVKTATRRRSGGGLARGLSSPLSRPLSSSLDGSYGPARLIVSLKDGTSKEFIKVANRAKEFWADFINKNYT